VLVARPEVGRVIEQDGLAGAIRCVEQVLGESGGSERTGDRAGDQGDDRPGNERST
jgi:hypothetical protein